MKKRTGCLLTIIFFVLILVFISWITSIKDTNIKIILCLYTAFILIAYPIAIRIYLKIYAKSTFDELFLKNDYESLIRILEQDKDNATFGWEHDNAIVYMYFINNNYDKYIKAVKSYTPMDFEKEPEIYLRIINLFKITELVFMYLNEEIDNANLEYQKYTEKNDDIEKKLFTLDHKTWELFQVLKMIYTYHNENYNEAEKVYKHISTFAYNKTVKTLISYYMCRIYEAEGNMNAIKDILIDTDIQNNPFGIYLEKWRVKQ